MVAGLRFLPGTQLASWLAAPLAALLQTPAPTPAAAPDQDPSSTLAGLESALDDDAAQAASKDPEAKKPGQGQKSGGKSKKTVPAKDPAPKTETPAPADPSPAAPAPGVAASSLLSPAAAQAQEPPAANATKAPPVANPAENDWKSLKRREEELQRREQALKTLEGDLDLKLAKLAAMEKNIKTMLEEATAVKDKKIKHLVDVYANMKAKQAAQVIETLEEDLAVKILSGMRGQQAGEILTFVTPKKAATLSEALTKLQIPFGK